MPWALQSTTSAPPRGDDRWFAIPLQPGAGIQAYGFRVVPLAVPFPSSWQIAGLWQIGQSVEGAYSLSAIAQLSLFAVPNVVTLQVIGPENVVELNGSVSSTDILISLNRWIPSRTIEVWVLWA